MATPPVPAKELARCMEAVKASGGELRAAARALGLAESTLRSRLKQAPAAVKAPEAGKKAGRSFAEFRESHDKNYIVPRKIKDALKQIGEGWEYEQQFLRLAGVSPMDLNVFRPQFENHVVIVERSKRVWCGTVAFATRLREMV